VYSALIGAVPGIYVLAMIFVVIEMIVRSAFEPQRTFTAKAQSESDQKFAWDERGLTPVGCRPKPPRSRFVWFPNRDGLESDRVPACIFLDVLLSP
jgi:hypothetical protein